MRLGFWRRVKVRAEGSLGARVIGWGAAERESKGVTSKYAENIINCWLKQSKGDRALTAAFYTGYAFDHIAIVYCLFTFGGNVGIMSSTLHARLTIQGSQ